MVFDGKPNVNIIEDNFKWQIIFLLLYSTLLFAFSFNGLIKMYLDVNLQVYPTWSSLNVGYWLKWSEVKVAQSCQTLCDSMDYMVHGNL